MTDSPVFSKSDADRILMRAAELEGIEDTRPVTIDELRSIAGEAGFGRHAVERAIDEARQSLPTQVQHNPVIRTGFIFFNRISTVRTVSVELNSDELMRAIRLFHPYRDGAAQVKLEVDRITWRDRKGLAFTVTSDGGVTEIRVLASKLFLLRVGRRIGWVKAAADRLESMIRLVDARGPHRLAVLESGGDSTDSS